MPTAVARIVIPLVSALAFAGGLPASGANCEGLSSAKLKNARITVAESVPEGKFTPPYGNAIDKLPAFCRVAGLLTPTSDSYIHFEVWLPSAGWNDKFLGVGNGGFAGSIDYNSMANDLKRGYATAATDTGHEADGVDASWAFKHPEKVIDFGYRAVHETAELAKSIIESFYTHAPQHSYFDSCSDGGREALMEAQRFPDDYQGILAGAPANFWTHMLAAGISGTQAMYGNPAAYISSIKLPAITDAVMAACDAQDGVKDEIINDPTGCRFDPSVLLCKGADSRTCLTQPQVDTLKKLYAGGQDSHGAQIFPGFMPGGETSGWSQWLMGPGPGGGAISIYVENYFRYMVFEDPAWDSLTANVDSAEGRADEKTARALNATDPDLSRFEARGGKLILYHGWSDPAISPLNTVSYYNSVLKSLGRQKAESFVRLYMIPGMQHCIGGPGPSSFGQLGTKTARGPEHGIYTALEQWVEKGLTPGDVVATKYVEDSSAKGVQITRPLCPYPQLAKYKGSGDTNEYTSFECVAPSH